MISLRKITVNDTDNIIKWRNNPKVREYFIQRDLLTKKIHENWLKTMVNSGKVVQYIILDDDMPVGTVYLRDIDQKNNKAEFGIFIGEDSARGKGIGSQAAQQILEIGFNQLHLHKIFLRVFADNIAGIKSYERAGFKKEGYFSDDVKIDGEYKDIVYMGLINKGEQRD